MGGKRKTNMEKVLEGLDQTKQMERLLSSVGENGPEAIVPLPPNYGIKTDSFTGITIPNPFDDSDEQFGSCKSHYKREDGHLVQCARESGHDRPHTGPSGTLRGVISWRTKDEWSGIIDNRPPAGPTRPKGRSPAAQAVFGDKATDKS